MHKYRRALAAQGQGYHSAILRGFIQYDLYIEIQEAVFVEIVARVAAGYGFRQQVRSAGKVAMIDIGKGVGSRSLIRKGSHGIVVLLCKGLQSLTAGYGFEIAFGSGGEILRLVFSLPHIDLSRIERSCFIAELCTVEYIVVFPLPLFSNSVKKLPLSVRAGER